MIGFLPIYLLCDTLTQSLLRSLLHLSPRLATEQVV